MTDNSLKVSELPTASNVASTDRVLLLYNAAGNTSINSGAASVRTVNVSTIVVSNTSKNANGYVYFANGVIQQWGTVSANSTTGNATFAIAFPTACQSVTLSVIGSANIAYQAAAPNTTVATIRTTSTTTGVSVQFQAIGY
jgi:hypothetical protein